MIRAISLRRLGLVLMLCAFAMGALSGWMWSSSSAAWQRHLNQSYMAGLALYDALRTGGALPAGVTATPLSPPDAARADQGEYNRISGMPTPAFVTNVSVLGQSRDVITGEAVTLGLVSGDLRYSVSDLVSQPGQSAAQKLGAVTRLVATYCSDAILVIRITDQSWMRVEAPGVWGCAAAPRDLRLIAVICAGVALAILATLFADTSAHFERFANALRQRRRIGGPQSYALEGPSELREIMTAVNGYLEGERAQLSKRATVLSGVSHDLGTPANRLRLRTALIQDAELRGKLEADIDSMTDMIESALTYTRAELSAEEPRQISLVSFVEAIVDDYRDMGRPVSLRPLAPQLAQGAASVFAAQRGQGGMGQAPTILATARPIMLQRALANLIDNALKYGRRAVIELAADAEFATIIVEDEGTDMTSRDMEMLLAPFSRGQNADGVRGFGLGLTIVASVAEQHGGELRFESAPHGLRACLVICRT